MADEVQRELNTEVQAGVEHNVDPKALGFDATMLVGLAMAIVVILLVWKKVPAAIGRALDGKIAGIRAQLDEAAALRAEAEQIRAEYEARSAASESEAAAMLERARHEAEAIRTKAEADAAALVERRTRMAEDKIAAEERAALSALRATAADAAAKAAARIIADRHDAATDKALIDQAIAGIR
ncbi:F0F1 ATP synthase subunit B [Sphingomonas sp. LHG3406-1]|uniref:F0F1 ATP synthase subunit B family protein n=1 Tax=Sphingomonas sp. LHG3406-1 TaxID=2804617 RepID=UPI0026188744|nr:F0F1 ATP synthase subunit B [Sphingomonas sp. LHG3406-1]